MRPFRRLVYAYSLVLSLHTGAQSLPDVANRINDFGLRLYEHASHHDEGGNRVISPVASYLALAMATAGAANETRGLLLSRLGYQPSVDGVKFLNAGIELCQDALARPEGLQARDARAAIANSAWVSTEPFAGRVFELASAYRERLETTYGADVTRLDFRDVNSAPHVNHWARQRTFGDLDEIVSATEVEDLMLLLLNTTYFRGWWQHAFDKSYDDASKRFHRADGRVVESESIGARGDFAHFRNAEEEYVEIPFRNGPDQTYVFYAVLPKAGTDLGKYRNPSAWSTVRKVLAAAPHKDGYVVLPTFEFPYGYKMTENAKLTKSLGLGALFEDTADFSAMKTPASPPAKIDFVKSVNRIALDVTGVTASAAGALGMVLAGGAPTTPEFVMKVDRPFAFAIAEKRSGLMVFVGEINDPTVR